MAPRARRRAGWPSARMRPTSWGACAWMTRAAWPRCCSMPPQSEIIGVSASAAERVVGALESVGEVRKAQVQQAGFVVLKSPDIPSMLVETAYISNPDEERHLRTASQQSAAGRGDCQRRAQLLPAEPPGWHALQAAAARKPGQRRRRLRRGGHSLNCPGARRERRAPGRFACRLTRLHAYPRTLRRTRRPDRCRRSDRAAGLGRQGARREQPRRGRPAHRDRRRARRHRPGSRAR